MKNAVVEKEIPQNSGNAGQQFGVFKVSFESYQNKHLFLYYFINFQIVHNTLSHISAYFGQFQTNLKMRGANFLSWESMFATFVTLRH